MNKRDFFIEAIKAEAYLNTAWGILTMSVVENADTMDPFPYMVRPNGEEGLYEFYKEGEWIVIEDTDITLPLINPKDELTLEAGTMANLSVDVKTTYGCALVNKFLIADCFGGAIDFMNGV